MICVVKMNGAEIKGWIIATDTHDARRQAEGIGERTLASALYRMEFVRPGKHELPGGYVVLVS